MNSNRRIYIRTADYKSGTELELQSVRDVLTVSRCTVAEIINKTDMPRAKVLDCLRSLIREKCLGRVGDKYFVVT